jgi:hypothetical protein
LSCSIYSCLLMKRSCQRGSADILRYRHIRRVDPSGFAARFGFMAGRA